MQQDVALHSGLCVHFMFSLGKKENSFVKNIKTAITSNRAVFAEDMQTLLKHAQVRTNAKAKSVQHRQKQP